MIYNEYRFSRNLNDVNLPPFCRNNVFGSSSSKEKKMGYCDFVTDGVCCLSAVGV